MTDVLGANEFTEQPVDKQKLRSAGWKRVRSWLGPRALVDSFILTTIKPLNPAEIKIAEGTPTLVSALFGDDPVLGSDPEQEAEDEAVWELIPSPLDKPLATHPAFGKYTGGALTTWAEEVEQIQAALRRGRALQQAWIMDNSAEYAKLRARGVVSWRTWQWVVRKTISVGEEVDLQAEEVDTQKIVTYANIGIPATVKWAQPVFRKWDGVNAVEIPIAEWMAAPPSISYTKGKYDIVREWIGAVAWYAILYEGGTAAADG